MAKLPKLEISWAFRYPNEETYDTTYELEQAKEFLFDPAVLAFVDGQLINSYDELIHLVADDEYKGKEVLKVILIRRGVGG